MFLSSKDRCWAHEPACLEESIKKFMSIVQSDLILQPWAAAWVAPRTGSVAVDLLLPQVQNVDEGISNKVTNTHTADVIEQ